VVSTCVLEHVRSLRAPDEPLLDDLGRHRGVVAEAVGELEGELEHGRVVVAAAVRPQAGHCRPQQGLGARVVARVVAEVGQLQHQHHGRLAARAVELLQRRLERLRRRRRRRPRAPAPLAQPLLVCG
jgi:hypothetical protein